MRLTRNDRLTRSVTAYSSYGALLVATASGYVPMLRREGAQLELGSVLEHAGRRVYWT